MSIEKVRAAFAAQGIADRIRELDESSATVALAAQALGCEPGRIAKTLSFQGKEQPILIVAAGDGKIDNHRFKERFGVTDVRADFIGPVIGAHTGCGTLGLFFVGTQR